MNQADLMKIQEVEYLSKMTDFYDHTVGKLNFHQAAIDGIQKMGQLTPRDEYHLMYHRREADDILHAINWLEVRHGKRSL
jgi:hypothetical protein